MAEYNTGDIYTNEKCIGCSRCMTVCPAADTNFTEIKHGSRKINVKAANCISCGRCINECKHGARVIRDDTDEFFAALSSGEKISLIIDPTFYVLYGERAENILGWLVSLGAGTIYDSAFGSDISAWLHAKFLKEYTGSPVKKPFIANFCPSVTLFVQRYMPDMLPYLIPVQSPSNCTAIYAKKYLGEENKLAFIGPCIAKRSEIRSKDADGLIDYSITIAELDKRLKNIDMSAFDAKSSLREVGAGAVVCAHSGIVTYFSMLFPPDETIVGYDGMDEQTNAIVRPIMKKDILHPLIAGMASCVGGCVYSPGTPKKTDADNREVLINFRKLRRKIIASNSRFSTPEEHYAFLCETFRELDPKDFSRGFEDKYLQPFPVPEHIINNIYNRMYKLSALDRHIDCRSCGYSTCRELVDSVARGTACIEDCVHYVNNELRNKLYFDTLTGLASSIGFQTIGRRYLMSHPEKKFMVCAVNINNLKVINDLYNFAVGSKVLIHVAKRLNSVVGSSGVCARLGGNNFVMCFESTLEILKRLKSIEYFDCGEYGLTMPVTARFGLCEIKAGEDLSRIMNSASFAMERITDKSKNRFILYDEEMKLDIYTETLITAQMTEAMKNGEFVMYLQPQYDHSTGGMVGAETLCRWVKPDGDIVSPAVFIPIFEKNGFIKELDRHMWESAFAQLAKWIGEGRRLVPISVNISRVSLLDDEIIDVISDLKNRYPIDTRLMHFEITESAYTANQNELIKRICRIRDLGFEIAMDDFGSGYSSLNSLKDIPIDILKLDMGFLRGGTNSGKGGNIIGSVIRMAHSLNLVTVAEGVETVEQADFLNSLGCDVIQGFLYARPMPTPQFEELLSSGSVMQVTSGRHISVDMNTLFDPDSNDSRMFNKYPSAAGVFEYENERLGIVRLNKGFIKLFGLTEYDKTDFEKIMLLRMKLAATEKLKKTVAASLNGPEGASCIFSYEREDMNITVKMRAVHICDNGTKSMIYLTADDVSDVMAYFQR